MKKEYDFSKAEQGKFYRPVEELDIPVYLDRKIGNFFRKKALDHHLDYNKLIESILKKEMDLLKKLG
jgi:hypothetical protein